MALRYHEGVGPWQGRNVRYGGFDYNFAGMARCAVGPELRVAVTQVTAQAMSYAEMIAPAGQPEYRSGFRTGVRVIPDFPDRFGSDPPMARWGGYVQNVASNAVTIEIGAKGERPYRVLTRTLDWLETVADD